MKWTSEARLLCGIYQVSRDTMNRMVNAQKAKKLKAIVLGSNDGIVTTFAVVAGSVGAGLNVKTIIILGVASMLADAVSMGVGDYLGERSAARLEKSGKMPSKLSSLETGALTFGAFLLAGSLPLVPYVIQLFGYTLPSEWQFPLSVFATGAALFIVGSLRVLITPGNWLKYGLEMLGIGAIAALIAYHVGSFIESLL